MLSSPAEGAERGKDTTSPGGGGGDSMDCDRPLSPVSVLDFCDWSNVPGLDACQVAALNRVATKGVMITSSSQPLPGREEPPPLSPPLPAAPAAAPGGGSRGSQVYTLHFGGEVEPDGNCLFSAASTLLQDPGGAPAARRAVVRRFLADYEGGALPREATDRAIRNLYAPDLAAGWGVHLVQEVKVLAGKVERGALDTCIRNLVACGMTSDSAAEAVYKEKCTAVADGASWAAFMSCSGSPGDAYDVVSLHYTEEGLLSCDHNADGRAAAFGDDIAIEALAREYNREVYVMQAHGGDAMVDEESCLFFLPHWPCGGPGSSPHPPLFLFMKGTGWCGAGGDHYDPVAVRPRAAHMAGEKAAICLP